MNGALYPFVVTQESLPILSNIMSRHRYWYIWTPPLTESYILVDLGSSYDFAGRWLHSRFKLSVAGQAQRILCANNYLWMRYGFKIQVGDHIKPFSEHKFEFLCNIHTLHT